MEIIGFLETGMTASNGFYYQVKGATCQDSNVFERYHENLYLAFFCQAKSAGPKTNHSVSTSGRLEVTQRPCEQRYIRKKDEIFG
jgi:hypothetical protein